MWCGKTCSAYMRVQAKTTVLTAILRGRLIWESPYTRVYTVDKIILICVGVI